MRINASQEERMYLAVYTLYAVFLPPVAEKDSISLQWHLTTCGHRWEKQKFNHEQTIGIFGKANVGLTRWVKHDSDFVLIRATRALAKYSDSDS